MFKYLLLLLLLLLLLHRHHHHHKGYSSSDSFFSYTLHIALGRNLLMPKNRNFYFCPHNLEK